MKHIRDMISPSHKAVSRSIGYALTTGDGLGWQHFTAVALLRLDDAERVGLAYAALCALHPDHIAPTLDAALGSAGAGSPMAPLFNHMNQAAFWADMAEPDELEAYCLASFTAMPARRKAAFLDFVQGRKAA